MKRKNKTTRIATPCGPLEVQMEKVRKALIATPSILVCDPSIRGWGYAVISKNTIVATGCIRTENESTKKRIRKGDDLVRRINEINTVLISLMRKHNVVHIVTEQPHGSQSATAAVMVGAVSGMLQTYSDTLDISIEYFSEGDCKKHLLGKRNAAKKETQLAISKIYTVPWSGKLYIDEAVADALAVYHLAKSTSPVIRFLAN